MDLKKFETRASIHKPRLKKFLKKFDKTYIPKMYPKQLELDAEVWKEVDCLECANCCKTMTPTFTQSDKKRIAAHLNMSVKELTEKYFEIDKDNGDTVNKATPCQWLNLKDNKCSIYEVRPVDCSGFPHHRKKKFDDYNHVYEQNLDKCPATLAMIMKLEEWIVGEYKW